jgi:hypothetical protein
MSGRKKLSEPLKQVQKIVKGYLDRPEAEPFHEPVDWQGWGLFDYPKLIKKPMDLGTVNKRLTEGHYKNPIEAAKDIRLVWKNCQTYNQDGSEFYTLSQQFSREFEEAFAKIKFEGSGSAAANAVDDDGPTLEEKTRFSQNIYKITSKQLGQVVQILDERCETCIDKTNPDEIEINIDGIDPASFYAVHNYVKSCLPDSANIKKKKKKTKDQPGGKAKKQKT